MKIRTYAVKDVFVLGGNSVKSHSVEFLVVFAGNGTVEIDEFMTIMLQRNSEGLTKWQITEAPPKAKSSEPPHWKAFKVSPANRLNGGHLKEVQRATPLEGV